MRKLLAVSVFVLVALLILLVLPVSALHEKIVIPVDTIIKGPEGSVHVLAEEDISEDLWGLLCDVDIEVDNQDSAHPDSDIRIISGTTLLFSDVEDPAFNVFVGSGQIVLNEKLSITLTLGEDEVWSAGLIVEIECETRPTTTTTTSISTTTTETTVVSSTTTVTTTPVTTSTTLPPTPTTQLTTTTGPSSTPTTLPFTGDSQGAMAAGAGAALSLGFYLVWLSVVTRGREDV